MISQIVCFIFSLSMSVASAQTPPQQGQLMPPPQPPPLNPAGPANSGLPPNGVRPFDDPNLRSSNDPLTGLLDPFEYQERGRRDPFVRPTVDKPVSEGQNHGPFLPLQQYDLTDLKLTGIIWDVLRPKAMIVDKDNKVHIVGPNTKIGKNNGYIAVIREGEIVIVETFEEEGRLISSTKLMRLASK